jgi:antitoxin PrlF
MPTSTITSQGQTTVPKEVRDALNVGAGDRLTWEIRGGSVVITTGRPALYRLEGFIRHGPDALTAIAEARKARRRIGGA